ncbi:MAG: hypothetical protein JWO03_2640 [Bacteroidetes bacterium]|nr:hypothetical protein [Bacteroidota bacterium]
MMVCLMYAHSQTTLSFCTFVNATNQECVFDNTKFITSPDSTHAKLFLMLRGNEVFGTTHLIYKIYAIDRFEKEVFLFEVGQEVESIWMNAWQPVVFNTPSKYMVKVFRDPTHLIVSRGFEFFNN